MTQARQRVAIIGAGISGLALTSLLARRGYEVVVFEKRRQLTQVIVGDRRSIGLAISFRGIRAMRHLGLGRALRALTVPMRGRVVHGLDGATAPLQRYDLVGNRAIFAIERDALLELLFRHASSLGEIHFGRECIGVDSKTGDIRLRDSAHREWTERFDGVVGADGVASIVRADILHGLGKTGAAPTPYSHAYKELTIPVAAVGWATLDRNALHVWPRDGFMLIAIPNRDGSFMATLFLPKIGRQSFAALRNRREVERFFVRHFPDVLTLCPALGEEFFANPIGQIWTVQDRHWHRGRAVILGDAAHAMVPFFGQGMNCALEDCLELDAHMGCHRRLTAAFKAFARTRPRDAGAIASLSVENYREMRSVRNAVEVVNERRTEAMLQRRHPRRYMPLYSMVSFTAIPYSTVRQHAKAQLRIREQLRRASGGKPLDRLFADRLILRDLPPLPPLSALRVPRRKAF